MSHSYCINDERPAPLASAKQETANAALWGRVAPTLLLLPRGIWPFDAHLLCVKYVYVHAGAEMPAEKRRRSAHACCIRVPCSQRGAALPWPWHLRPTHPSPRLV